MTQPQQRTQSSDSVSKAGAESPRPQSGEARNHWKKVGLIARRAGGDDVSESDGDEDMSEGQKEERRRKRLQEKRERDMKHRYGSNLRTYHEVWKTSDTNENFFYWLDHGEGLKVDLPMCSRERLDREQVRYLSREERMNYLVKIDGEGKLCWAKNGARIDTSERFKDSIHGIVPENDETPPYTPRAEEASAQSSTSSSSATSSGPSSAASNRANRYVNQDLKKTKGPRKVKHVSAVTILNHLLRKSVKKNTWIFVADTSFRLYVGIKQSGAFQHSSFLNGARISAAGLIKIKAGQLRSLSPLSGHYRPPTRNFRAFVHSLKDAGADTSRVSISKSYAVLVGLETYVRTRKKIKHAGERVNHTADKVIRPELVAKRDEEGKDKSQSAEKERQVLTKKKDHSPHSLVAANARASAGSQAPREVEPGGGGDCRKAGGARDSFLRKLGFRS
ncbi:MAG: hypothetical protein M1837_007346 [Sclerophora amabilis]|nr:MAG: hypothetical protein M1837_007346 [Sclerophora amabilis]